MDGTLIDTSYANFLAYSDSIKRITGRGIAASHDKSERFTRNSLEKIGFEVRKCVNGTLLVIEGGEYKLCSERGKGCGRGCRRHVLNEGE